MAWRIRYGSDRRHIISETLDTHGWDRRQVRNELRKLSISMVIRSTGSVYQGSKHSGHSDIRVTQEVYGELLEKQKVQIPMPKKF